MSDTVRVFVNGHGLDAPAGATALEAVRAWSAADADALSRGELVVTDSRGLPVPATLPVVNGAIFRLVPHRDRGAAVPRRPGTER